MRTVEELDERLAEYACEVWVENRIMGRFQIFRLALYGVKFFVPELKGPLVLLIKHREVGTISSHLQVLHLY